MDVRTTIEDHQFSGPDNPHWRRPTDINENISEEIEFVSLHPADLIPFNMCPFRTHFWPATTLLATEFTAR
jgi:hypothetical protein